jgi:hypothetical protein
VAGAADAPKEPEAPHDPAGEAASSADDGGPNGPLEGEEASFLADQPSMEPALSPGAPALEPATPPADDSDLPPLDDLVQRIPASTRALVEELFRAKFVAVKRLPKSAFKD